MITDFLHCETPENMRKLSIKKYFSSLLYITHLDCNILKTSWNKNLHEKSTNKKPFFAKKTKSLLSQQAFCFRGPTWT